MDGTAVQGVMQIIWPLFRDPGRGEPTCTNHLRGMGIVYGGGKRFADHLVSLKRPLGEVSRPPQNTTWGKKDGTAGHGVMQIIWYLFQTPGEVSPPLAMWAHGMTCASPLAGSEFGCKRNPRYDNLVSL